MNLKERDAKGLCRNAEWEEQPSENSTCVCGIKCQVTWEAEIFGDGLLSLSRQCPLIVGIDLSLNTDIII